MSLPRSRRQPTAVTRAIPARMRVNLRLARIAILSSVRVGSVLQQVHSEVRSDRAASEQQVVILPEFLIPQERREHGEARASEPELRARPPRSLEKCQKGTHGVNSSRYSWAAEMTSPRSSKYSCSDGTPVRYSSSKYPFWIS